MLWFAGVMLDWIINLINNLQLPKKRRLPVCCVPHSTWHRGQYPVPSTLSHSPLHLAVCTLLQIHVEHMAERFGLWVMLVLGESMISLVTVKVVQDWQHYLVVFVGLVIVFFLQHLYFDAQPVHANDHAFR